MDPVIILGILACSALGVAGGGVGTFLSIRNTKGPRERAFMVRVSIITWVAVTLFVAALMLLPKPYNWLLWIPYGIALPLSVRRWNRKQLEIRIQESGAQSAGTSPPSGP
jgi:hypothetical protein